MPLIPYVLCPHSHSRVNPRIPITAAKVDTVKTAHLGVFKETKVQFPGAIVRPKDHSHVVLHAVGTSTRVALQANTGIRLHRLAMRKAKQLNRYRTFPLVQDAVVYQVFGLAIRVNTIPSKEVVILRAKTNAVPDLVTNRLSSETEKERRPSRISFETPL